MVLSIQEIMSIYEGVAVRLSLTETFGEGYGLDCFEFNIECVMKDIKAGKVAKPVTKVDWIETIVAEYRANLPKKVTFHFYR